jgi:hypothetical protein
VGGGRRLPPSKDTTASRTGGSLLNKGGVLNSELEEASRWGDILDLGKGLYSGAFVGLIR